MKQSQSSLHETAPLVSARPYPPPTMADADGAFVPMQLVLLPSGMSIELTKPDLLMGRHTAADIRLPLADVSRKHCRFVFAGMSWKVIDLDSLNGVYVNDQLVKEAVLCHGDRLRIGSFVFEVRLPESLRRNHLRRAS